MTSDLHERLGDLVADVPAYVVPDPRAAWVAGARRRARHRVGVLAAVVAVLALLAGAATWLPRTLEPAPADPNGAAVHGYPTRIDKPWRLHDLPARPGPLAGVLEGEDGRLLAVSEQGHVWRLPRSVRADQYPVALSADGTHLAYLADRHRFVVRDLVAGTTRVAEGVGDGGFDGPTETHGSDAFQVVAQSPAFWSPTDDRVFVLGALGTSMEGGALLVGSDGGTTVPPAPRVRVEDSVWPAGWTPRGDLVWIAGDADREVARWAQAVVTTTTGRVVRRVDLQLPPGTGSLAAQWSGSVSPDGRTIVVRTEASASRVGLFSLVDGSFVRTLPAHDIVCPTSWAADGPRNASGGTVVAADGSPLIEVDHALNSFCLRMATNALSGSAHPVTLRLLGVPWPVVVAPGMGVLVAAVLLGVRRVRRRARRRVRPRARTS